jgi:hypothetical protein
MNKGCNHIKFKNNPQCESMGCQARQKATDMLFDILFSGHISLYTYYSRRHNIICFLSHLAPHAYESAVLFETLLILSIQNTIYIIATDLTTIH